MRAMQTITNNYNRRRGMTERKAWCLTNNLWMTRISKKLSQQQLATKLGVSRQTISRIERGHHEPFIGMAIAIAEALEVPVEQLFNVVPTPAALWRSNPWQTSSRDTIRLQQQRLF